MKGWMNQSTGLYLVHFACALFVNEAQWSAEKGGTVLEPQPMRHCRKKIHHVWQHNGTTSTRGTSLNMTNVVLPLIWNVLLWIVDKFAVWKPPLPADCRETRAVTQVVVLQGLTFTERPPSSRSLVEPLIWVSLLSVSRGQLVSSWFSKIITVIYFSNAGVKNNV